MLREVKAMHRAILLTRDVEIGTSQVAEEPRRRTTLPPIWLLEWEKDDVLADWK